MARPRFWEHGDGACAALLPPPAMLDTFRGSGDFAGYREALLRAWDGRPLAPGVLCSSTGVLVSDGDSLLCACAKGKPCHRQIAAALLVAAGWRVLLDGEEATPALANPPERWSQRGLFG